MIQCDSTEGVNQITYLGHRQRPSRSGTAGGTNHHTQGGPIDPPAAGRAPVRREDKG